MLKKMSLILIVAVLFASVIKIAHEEYGINFNLLAAPEPVFRSVMERQSFYCFNLPLAKKCDSLLSANRRADREGLAENPFKLDETHRTVAEMQASSNWDARTMNGVSKYPSSLQELVYFVDDATDLSVSASYKKADKAVREYFEDEIIDLSASQKKTIIEHCADRYATGSKLSESMDLATCMQVPSISDCGAVNLPARFSGLCPSQKD